MSKTDFSEHQLSKEDIEVLEGAGYKEYAPELITDFYNPHSQTYWVTNGLITVAAIFGRQWAKKNKAPTIAYSLTIVAVPFFSLLTTYNLDFKERGFGKKKTLEERLDYYPITRRAWNKAKLKNSTFQADLKNEIAELEEKIRARKGE